MDYYDIQTDELLDLMEFDKKGFVKLKDNGNLIEADRYYEIEELLLIETMFNNRKNKPKIKTENLVSLAKIQEDIKANAFDYDKRYPVETLECRYSEYLNHYRFLAVKFDPEKRIFIYTDLYSGIPMTIDMLKTYEVYPREKVFNKPDYSPRELFSMHFNLNIAGRHY
jgi:hypothetical protein